MKVLIELEFLDAPKDELSEELLKDSVYTYLTDLMEDDRIVYTVDGAENE